ncbi:MAG: peptidylprolyl isomerase [Planctomycetota bacterium]
MGRRIALLALFAACSKVDRKALLDPNLARARAPQTFRVKFETTKGDFVVDVYRDWAPHGVDRFYNLVRIGFYNGCAFFRVTPQVAQFGLSSDKDVSRAWLEEFVPADPPKQSNRRGFVSLTQAARSPDKRTTQVLVSRADNPALDHESPPIGEVVGDGMRVVDALYAGYGDGTPTGPVQGRIITEGGKYLKREFPRLDTIKRARLID